LPEFPAAAAGYPWIRRAAAATCQARAGRPFISSPFPFPPRKVSRISPKISSRSLSASYPLNPSIHRETLLPHNQIKMYLAIGTTTCCCPSGIKTIILHLAVANHTIISNARRRSMLDLAAQS
jgi:hypothetical protein